MFGVAFLYAGSLWFLFVVEVPHMGGGGWVTCQGSLVREVSVGVLVGRADFFSLECNEVPSSEF